MSRFGLFGEITTIEGKRDELVTILLEAAEAMNTLEECELYIVSVKEEVPDGIWITEVWQNAEAHQSSLSLDAIKNLIEKGRPLIKGMNTMNTFSPLGGKGL
ncbi:antibiotic biosynthesis monooxygenase [Paenisporosarcina quisquiliarum]|jgi:quinol monooxygenase YgiN|uniref:Antibiotic biosynthesis monooxygenase n=1 Tax=Paenisporosarcina quisquiliarum TaxID=365346 RepID=A0A9X3LI27_9BACL|nr:antibiotic biosynthesis monooxygenase [Paenisporosarcina quisquiliarum]MCZ8536859.1 antibiotic biosynthesis monooxygenase [Paenisporosarcina quisquiliarum]